MALLTEASVAWAERTTATRRVKGSRYSSSLSGAGLAAQFVDLLRNRQYPLVFLKQFRDVADSSRACYQAVAEAPVQIGAKAVASHELGSRDTGR